MVKFWPMNKYSQFGTSEHSADPLRHNGMLRTIRIHQRPVRPSTLILEVLIDFGNAFTCKNTLPTYDHARSKRLAKGAGRKPCNSTRGSKTLQSHGTHKEYINYTPPQITLGIDLSTRSYLAPNLTPKYNFLLISTSPNQLLPLAYDIPST